MKKLLVLFSIFLCYSVAHSQTLTTTASTVNTGATVTLTGSGETINQFFVAYNGTLTNGVNPVADTQYAGVSEIGATYYNKTTGAPTVVQLQVKNTGTVPITVTYQVQMTPYDNVNFKTMPPVYINFTVTINPAPLVGNDPQSGWWSKNGCGNGYSGTAVQYTIAANTYFETTKAAANQDAINALNANGQVYANNNGQCVPSTTFPVYNRSQSSLSITFQTTDGSQQNFGGVVNPGSTVNFTINPYTYNIIISPAQMPINATFRLSTGEQYGPSPGHTFTNVTIGAGHTVDLEAF